jgi:hypothetical protein
MKKRILKVRIQKPEFSYSLSTRYSPKESLRTLLIPILQIAAGDGRDVYTLPCSIAVS